ncbi:amino acid adenylation domain-containing protein [Saccharothrix coeruleofusca]|uniref:non-ribosomal peptide synthetase n=1 Tax=Saccharothrix coeruleofusca TaxID=33919 RepID=UPI001AEB42EB|nr:non-ribosomal peptide synthetase [Saccharothrix coeruleofusca]MBP2336652.1 amino acid adenylation domain-containing protein [Saccharothrix coeruleofusca]
MEPTGIVEAVDRLLTEVRPDGAEARPPGALREWGLSSLALARLWLGIKDEFSVDLPIPWLGAATAADLVERLRGATAEPAQRLPLTPLQRAYLVAKQAGAGVEAAGCHLYREFTVPDVDPARLRRAWQDLVEHHEALRLVVDEDGSQRVLPPSADCALPVHDLTGAEPPGVAAHLRSVRERLSHHCFPAGSSPLFAVELSRLPGGGGVVHLGLDTLVTDGHGYALLLQQWHDRYQHPDAPLPRQGPPLAECLSALEARKRPHREADLAWWRQELADLPSGPDLVLDPPPAQAGGCRPRRPLDAHLPAEPWRALKDAAARQGVSPTALVLHLFTGALARAGARYPFSLVVTTSDRPWLPRSADAVVGPFTSTALHVVREPASPAEGARAAHEQLLDHLRHGAVSGIEVLQDLRAAGRDHVPPAVVFTSLLDVGPAPGVAGGFGAAIGHGVSQTSDVALDHQMWEQDGGLRFRWDVDASRFAAGDVETVFAAFRNALLAAAADPGGGDPAPLPELTQAYAVARLSAEERPEGCQCYRGYEAHDLDLARLERALGTVVDRHAALRARFTPEGVRVVPRGPDRWHVALVEVPSEAEHRAVGERLRARMANLPAPFGHWPLIDVRVTRDPSGRCVAHVAVDLLVGDAPSVHALFRELWRCYADGGTVFRASDAPPTAREGHDAEHWRRLLADLPPAPRLPVRVPERSRERFSGRLPGYRDFARRAAGLGLSPDSVLLAAFARVLSRHFTEPFSLPAVRWADAPRPGEFSVMTQVRAVAAGEPLLAAARRYQERFDRDDRAGAAGGLREMRRLASKRGDGAGQPVVYTGVVDLTDHPLPAGVRQGPWLTSTPGCALDCVSVAEGDELDYAWDVVPGDLAGVPVDELFQGFARELELFRDGFEPSAEQRLDVLRRWNGPVVPIPDDGPVHRLFERWARSGPDAVALRWRTGSMTRVELNRRANRIAWRLRELGVGPERVVGIRIRRGPAMVAAVHGVLKAGGAYLPVDPALPPARVARVLATAGAEVLLTAAGTAGSAPEGVIEVEVDRDPAVVGHPRADEDPEPVADQRSTAYVIPTSGSTGEPKGVAVAHRSVRNLIAFCAEEFALVPDDLALAVTSLGFDLSVFDVLGVLGAGAALYVADEEEQKDPQLLLDVLRSRPVTLWNSAPTALHQLTPLLRPHGGDPSAARLRLVLLSGDFIPVTLPDRITEAFPRARTTALGGPTETTVWSNYFRVERVDPRWRSIPYGRPIPNTRHYVLDERLEPCPVGVEGDLYTAGECLALGYLGRPDLTAERFVPDPFAGAGERMLRTGDRARWRPDGNLVITGRADRQVKVRGQRVEPGEVEHRLRAHPAVRDVVVAVRRDHSGDDRLVAYVVPAEGGRTDAKALRAHAAETLPPYMVPSAVAFLPAFPATANGKLDRDALPWPLEQADDRPAVTPAPARPAPGQAADACAAPAPEDLVEQVREVFAEVLGAGELEVDEDLWDQGATSFTMVQVSARLLSRYGERVPVAALTAEPTITGIARVVGQRLGAAPPAPEPARATPVPAAPRPAGPPSEVDLFSAEERAAFRQQRWNLRRTAPGTRLLPVEHLPPPTEVYARRASRRDFLPGALDAASFARLLSLLRKGEDRYLYPSAGDTYAVQVYLHVKPGAVEGLAEGIYYYHPVEHALELVNAAPRIDRNAHFYYNRPVFDRSGVGIYLIGQRHGVEPVYQEVAERFLLLEAGYAGQVLMMGQAACGVGLCPVGTVAFDGIRDQFDLDDGHVFLHAFMAGPVERPAAPTQATAGAPVLGAPAPTGEDTGDDIAVIGMAGRFPGAGDVDQFWASLRDGRCAVGPLPADRGLAEAPRVAGGFLERVDRFDSLRFRLSPAEAATLDPQLRLVLHAVWNCLEDAGYTATALVGSAPRVGVFTATMWQDYQHVGADAWGAGGQARISALPSEIPNRVSNAFGFTGPSVAVNTSCSSSLTALHLAVSSLRRGECDAAVVAAANLVLHPYHLALLSSAGLLARTGPVRAFAADSSGWCPGEGVAAVLLRPLDAARRERDTARAVVEATGIGHSGGGPFGRPDPRALADCVGDVLARAGLRPGDIGYVECAAAGAALADAAELEALARVFDGTPVLAGTLKPNIGHLESASGLSQLVKVLLQLRHRRIAPTLVAEDRSPLVDWTALPLRLVDRLVDWPPGAPARALVNALGATGSYGHVVVRAVERGDG